MIMLNDHHNHTDNKIECKHDIHIKMFMYTMLYIELCMVVHMKYNLEFT